MHPINKIKKNWLFYISPSSTSNPQKMDKVFTALSSWQLLTSNNKTLKITVFKSKFHDLNLFFL